MLTFRNETTSIPTTIAATASMTFHFTTVNYTRNNETKDGIGHTQTSLSIGNMTEEIDPGQFSFSRKTSFSFPQGEFPVSDRPFICVYEYEKQMIKFAFLYVQKLNSLLAL